MAINSKNIGLMLTAGLAGIGASVALAAQREKERAIITMKAIDWDKGKEVLPERAFQWWPETFNDSGHEPIYDAKDIPGMNSPLLQWKGGGPRNFSFEVHFTRSVAPYKEGDAFIDTEDDRNKPFNVNIPACIAYMRVASMPSYVKNGASIDVAPPPLIYLNVPNHQLNEDGSDIVPCILRSCPVIHKKSFPDGTPRSVTMTLSFQRVIQSINGITQIGREAYLNRTSGNYGGNGNPIKDFVMFKKKG